MLSGSDLKINLSDDVYNFRKAELNDYENIINLLSELTEVGNISYDNYEEFIKNLSLNHHLEVIMKNNELVGCGTLLIENKLIHSCSKYGHIEDIVISSKYRKCGFGKLLITRLLCIAGLSGCYKVILNCSNHNIPFYEKCGFKKGGVSMFCKL
jgi:glucosamine-phosphate N-acetyltransferase